MSAKTRLTKLERRLLGMWSCQAGRQRNGYTGL